MTGREAPAGAALVLGSRFLIVVDDRPRRCGIHGDDTTSGRCASCDAEAGRE